MTTSHIETLLYVQMSLNRLLRSDGIRNCVVGVIDIPFFVVYVSIYTNGDLQVYHVIRGAC